MKDYNLTFDAESHKYNLNGADIPSVTQIIQKVLPTNFYVSEEVLEQKSLIGQYVHTATELYDQDNLDIDSLHPTLKGYLDGWIRFRMIFDIKPIAIELRLAHPVYKFAGRIDRVFEGDILVDIKTGVPQKMNALQLAGYKELWDYDKKSKDKIKKRIVVYLRKEGAFKIEEYKDISDKAIFLSCLNVYGWLSKNNGGVR